MFDRFFRSIFVKCVCDLCPQIIQKPSHDLKQQLANYSKRVASSVTELIQAAEAMKGTILYKHNINTLYCDLKPQTHLIKDSKQRNL